MQNLSHISSTSQSTGDQKAVDQNVAPSALSVSTIQKGWVLNPILDLLFVCGGSMWLLYAMTFAGMSSSGQDQNSIFYSQVLFWGAFFITNAHGPATLVRVYESKSTPPRTKLWVTTAAVVMIGISLVALTSLSIAQAFVKVTTIWVVQHYIAQTFGVMMIYCLKRNYQISGTQRFIFQNLMRSLTAFVIVRMFTYPEYGHIQNFMGMEIPFWGPLPTLAVLAAGYVFFLFLLAFVATIVHRFVVSREIIPWPGLLAVFTVAAIVLSPRTGNNGFYLLGVTFYHASQYLAITFSYFVKEKAIKKHGEIPLSLARQFLTMPALVYFAVIVFIGYLTTNWLPVNWIKISGMDGAIVLGTTYALINCHHFLADALIWRVRDPQVRKLLV